MIIFSASSKKKGKRKEKDKLTIDHGYLACQHHVSMVAGLGFVPNINTLKGEYICNLNC